MEFWLGQPSELDLFPSPFSTSLCSFLSCPLPLLARELMRWVKRLYSPVPSLNAEALLALEEHAGRRDWQMLDSAHLEAEPHLWVALPPSVHCDWEAQPTCVWLQTLDLPFRIIHKVNVSV